MSGHNALRSVADGRALLEYANRAQIRNYPMARLSRDQLAFLKRHKIPADRVFNATGMATVAYKAEMKLLEAWVAFGVTPCSEAGHTLRTRAGHCVQCSPANLSYLMRFDKAGDIYIAVSARGAMVKVGTAQWAEDRVLQLNSYCYGGQSDWVLRFKDRVAIAGRVEAEAHAKLAAYPAVGAYWKNGGFIESREIFSCSYRVAVAAVRKAILESQNSS